MMWILLRNSKLLCLFSCSRDGFPRKCFSRTRFRAFTISLSTAACSALSLASTEAISGNDLAPREAFHNHHLLSGSNNCSFCSIFRWATMYKTNSLHHLHLSPSRMLKSELAQSTATIVQGFSLFFFLRFLWRGKGYT